jgi:hypothetical protein
VDEVTKQFADLAAKYGPNVTDAMLGAVRIQVYSDLAQAVMGIIIGCLLLAGSLFMWRRTIISIYDDEAAWLVYRLVPFCLASTGVFFILINLWTWIDPWTWTALWHPEYWLAKQVLKM